MYNFVRLVHEVIGYTIRHFRPIIICCKICNTYFILQGEYFTPQHKFHRSLDINLVTYNFTKYLLFFCLETEWSWYGNAKYSSCNTKLKENLVRNTTCSEQMVYSAIETTCFGLYWPSSGFYNIEEESINAVKT